MCHHCDDRLDVESKKKTSCLILKKSRVWHYSVLLHLLIKATSALVYTHILLWSFEKPRRSSKQCVGRSSLGLPSELITIWMRCYLLLFLNVRPGLWLEAKNIKNCTFVFNTFDLCWIEAKSLPPSSAAALREVFNTFSALLPFNLKFKHVFNLIKSKPAQKNLKINDVK